jgi:gliding motility-associated-like protein
LNVSACDSYTLNNVRFDSTGDYTQIIPNSFGCDSVITLHLAINKKFTSQTKSICDGETFYAGGANQTRAGTYVDTLHTVAGCDSVVTTKLIVNAKPVPDLGGDKNLCVGSSLTVTPGVFTSYVWQDGASQSNFSVNTGGTYWVTVTNSNNCSATDTIRITAVQAPSNFLKALDSVCSYETLTIRPSGNFSSYVWSTGETQNNIVIQNPGEYWLKVTDINSCNGTDTITVVAKECMKGVYIPTAFSPNKDGKNDLFHPLIFGKIKKYYFAVYNRWGHIVFESKEVNKAWDGTVAGVLQDPNVYVWICTYQFEGEEVKTERGSVVLMR